MTFTDDADLVDELCDFLWEHHLDELSAASKTELRAQLQLKLSSHSH